MVLVQSDLLSKKKKSVQGYYQPGGELKTISICVIAIHS